MNFNQIGLIMRLTTVILIASLMQVSAAGLAQKISLSKSNASLKSVMKEIKQQSGYNFVYRDELLSMAKPVNIKVMGAELEAVLEKIFDGQPLSYALENKTVVIKEKEPSFLDRVASYFTDIDVRGVIRDEQGNPMPNATIQVKGKAQVYKSNEKGEFSIQNVADNAVLVIRYVGYKQLEIALKDAVMPLEIKLNMATGELEEVSIQYSTGYQDIPKERATGSFVQIDNELYNRKVSSNILDRIYEVTSGLNVRPSAGGLTGGLGDGRSPINIRGISTIFSNDRPLIVVDGFPFDGDINTLNPNDILSVSVLKDAAAASIWGVRAGNGVIVLTTKRGSYNKPVSLLFNSNVTIGDKPDLFYSRSISSSDYVDFEKQLFDKGVFDDYDGSYVGAKYFPVASKGIEIMLAAKRGDVSSAEAERQLNELRGRDVRNDIDKYLVQNSILQQYALNLTGGSDRLNYYGSFGYDHNRSDIMRNNNDRLTLKFDNSFKPIQKIEINSYINYTQTNQQNNGIRYDSFLASKVAPYTKMVDENGQPAAIPKDYRLAYVDTASYLAILDWHFRPLDELRNNDASTKGSDIRFGTNLKYSFIDGLSAEIKYQYHRSINQYKSLVTEEAYRTRDLINRFMSGSSSNPIYRIPRGAILDQTSSNLRSTNLRGQLNFQRLFNNHEIAVIAGAEVRETSTDRNSYRRYGYDPETGGVISVDLANSYPTNPQGGNTKIPNNDVVNGLYNYFTSYFSNASYSYLGRFTVSASGRIDESNFFGLKANQRKTPLWSAGLSWDIGKESFFKNNAFSDLKLRATYGFNGNTNNATALITAQYLNPDMFSITGLQYAAILTPPNPQLRWERVKIINIGLDFKTKGNRLDGTIEYYKKNGLDLISQISIDPTSGVNSFTGNNASIKGQGLDLTLNSKIIEKAIRWDASLLVSHSDDKITRYEFEPLPLNLINSGNSMNPGISNSYNSHALMLGKPLLSLYSYQWAGLNSSNGDPQIYMDGEKVGYQQRGLVKVSDIVYSGRVLPNIFGSFRNTLFYKNLSLSLNLTYKFGHHFRRNSINFSNLQSVWQGHMDYSNRWIKPGDETRTNVPSLSTNVDQNRDEAYLLSDILIEKADHIRLQDIRIDYSFNNLRNTKNAFKNINVYLYANNLGILWRANQYGIDPDYYIGNVIPPSKSLSLGINVNF